MAEPPMPPSLPPRALPPPPCRIDFVALHRYLSAFPGFRNGAAGEPSSAAVAARAIPAAVGAAALAERSVDLSAELVRLTAWASSPHSSAAQRSVAAAGYAASGAESARVEWLLKAVEASAPPPPPPPPPVGGRPPPPLIPTRLLASIPTYIPFITAPAPAPAPARGGDDSSDLGDPPRRLSAKPVPPQTTPTAAAQLTKLPAFHAVRVGCSVRSCVFVRWSDAERHVLDFDGAEYESFDDIGEAVTFARGTAESGSTAKVTKPATTAAAVVAKGSGKRKRKRAASSLESSDDDNNDDDGGDCYEEETEENDDRGNDDHDKVDEDKVRRGTAAKKRTGAKKKRSLRSDKSTGAVGGNGHDCRVGHEEGHRRMKLRSQWIEMYDRLRAVRDETGDVAIHPHDERNSDLRNWLTGQTRHIRKALEKAKEEDGADVSPLLLEKVRRLEALGLKLVEDSEKNEIRMALAKAKELGMKLMEDNAVGGQVSTATDAPRPSEKWLAMLERLRAYKDKQEHEGGSPFDFSPEDEENADLRQWLKNQVHTLRRSRTSPGGIFVTIRTGKPSEMFEEKARRLEALGFELPEGKPKKVGSWDQKWRDMYDKLRAYKEETGTSNVCDKDEKYASLWRWRTTQLAAIRGAIRKSQGGSNGNGSGEEENARKLHPAVEEKARLLEELGENVRKCPLNVGHSSRFDEMLERYTQYKAEHGGSELPQQSDDPCIAEICRWVGWQRVEYAKLKGGKESKLSAQNMQRLVVAGFDLTYESTRKKMGWEDRLVMLKEFKAIHGHLKVPAEHPTLGVFARQKRREYHKFVNGTGTSKIIETQIEDLEKLGFVFCTGFKRTPPAESKPWGLRFEELLRYKAENGHCVVPKHEPPLGNWVKKQRREYAKIKKGGTSTTLTPERIVQLTEAGFVWNAAGWGRGGREGFA